jgi:hypothetical protein
MGRGYILRINVNLYELGYFGLGDMLGPKE